MKHPFRSLIVGVALSALVVAGCSQAAPAPAPTTPPAPKAAEPAKPAEPAKAPAAAQPTAAPAKAATTQPTSAPAKKIDWPEKGRTITVISPWNAGNANDVLARLIADAMEKDLGTPVVVVNKPGASTQVGLTEFVKAKPDGYTLLQTSTLTTIMTYLDPERKAVYSRKDFEPAGVVVMDPMALAVKADGPYKTTKDLVDAAKAAPNKIKVADGGFATASHFATLGLGKAAGVQFATLHTGGSPEIQLRVLGGDADAQHSGSPDPLSHVKAGTMRVLANSGTSELPSYPGVKSLQQQGYNVRLVVSRAMSAPAGTPKEIVDIVSASLKRITENAEVRGKMEALGQVVQYMNAAQFKDLWNEEETQAKQLLDMAWAEQKASK